MTDALRAKADGSALLYGPAGGLLYGDVSTPITLAPLLHSYIQRTATSGESKDGPWWSHGQFTYEEMYAHYEVAKASFLSSTEWQPDAPSPTVELLFRGYRSLGVSNQTNVAWVSATVQAHCVFVYDTSAYVGRKITSVSSWTPWPTGQPTVPYGIILWPSETEKPATPWTEMVANFVPYPTQALPSEITLSNYLLVAGHIDLTETTANQNLYVNQTNMPARIE